MISTPPEQTPGESARSTAPAYLRIADHISRQVASGRYRPGDQLPTEAQLREEFGVSPMTVRRAINILLDRGLVTTTQGKGTFVRSLDMGEAVFKLQDLTAQWSQASMKVRLLQASIARADERAADRLKCAAGAETVFLRRLLLRDDIPVIYHREHVLYDPERPLVESQLQITSLPGLFEAAAGEGLTGGQLTIQAVGLDEEAAGHLRVSPGAPAFALEHVFHDSSGKPVSWGWFLCRADQVRLSATVGAGLPGRRP
ncbi:MAG: GntR family transcriptional regulator [Thermoleophilia bacterium]